MQATPTEPATRALLGVGLAGAAVALSLGIYAKAHDPGTDLDLTLGFSSAVTMKVWMATIALALACVQVVSALWIYGRLPVGAAPGWLGHLHRISGRLAFLVSLPVAYNCLYALGFQSGSTRVVVHSTAGCLVYGAFVTKVLVVRNHRLPPRALPLAGGLMFATLVVAWLTSALWFIDEQGFPSP